MNDRRQNRTCQDTQNRVFKQQQKIPEFRHIRQTGNGIGHGGHALHQHGKAKQDGTDVFFLVGLAEHSKDNADQRQDWGKGFWLQQLQHQTAALNSTQRQNPGRDGGTDIGTHDHIDGLTQLHQTGVNKADYHNGCGRTGLNNTGNCQTGDQTCKFIGGQFGKDQLQLASGTAFQRRTHDVHAEQEQAQTTKQA